jgi:YD repeat-containing protein
MKIKLIDIAHGRSGDKGDAANIGIIAYDANGYNIIKKQLTEERVKKHFESICLGKVERFELPNLKALNFLLHDTLGGGGTVSLKYDAQGKTLAAALLRMELEV